MPPGGGNVDKLVSFVQKLAILWVAGFVGVVALQARRGAQIDKSVLITAAVWATIIVAGFIGAWRKWASVKLARENAARMAEPSLPPDSGEQMLPDDDGGLEVRTKIRSGRRVTPEDIQMMLAQPETRQAGLICLHVLAEEMAGQAGYTVPSLRLEGEEQAPAEVEEPRPRGPQVYVVQSPFSRRRR